jgi:ribosomal protein S5
MTPPGQTPQFQMSTAAGFQQIGDQMFVTVAIMIGNVNVAVTLAIDHAKAFSKAIKDAAETAEVQIIKPKSLLDA